MMEQVIIITTEENKKKILRENSEKHSLINLKFYTFEELKKKLVFDYDLNAILYVVKSYQVSIPVAKIYLENLYFLQDLDNEKVRFLNQLKKELDQNHLLIYHESFKKIFKNKKIVVYGYPFLTKEQQLILSELDHSIEYKNDSNIFYQPNIYEAETMNEEVEFLMQEICGLLEKNISLSHIKIIASSSYEKILARYFSFFQIPYQVKNRHSFYSTSIAQDFLTHYDELSISENVLGLSEKYQNVNELICIINRTVNISDKEERKKFIIEDLKQAKIQESVYDSAVTIGDLNVSFREDDYVFLLGFNVGEYPKIKRDIDYLPDSIKTLLGLDTTTDENEYQMAFILDKIHSIKHLVITYPLNGSTGKCYPSVLVQKLASQVKPICLHSYISYSKVYSEMKYALALDLLYKFNTIHPDLAMYQNNLDIPYFQYDNQFKGIKNSQLIEKLKGELTLSYTNLEMYQECAFHYYVSKILRLDIFEETFKTILGSVMHHILELGLTKDIDIPVEMMKFVKEKGYVLSSKELFYLEIFSKELEKILKVILEQQKHSSLKKYLFETEFFVYKDREDMNVTFKGNVDKVMYEEIDGKEVLAVVDYKTGNTNITLKNLEYGLNIQLPIYLYLLKKSERFHDAFIAGFYIQKILANKENIQFKKSEKELLEERLRLRGFTNRDETLMKLVDKDYLDGKVLLNVKFKKDGELSSNSKVLSNEEMDEVIIKVDQIIDEVISHILHGDFAIHPKVIDGKNISCKYCKFRDLCYMRKQNEVVLGGEESEVDEGATVSN